MAPPLMRRIKARIFATEEKPESRTVHLNNSEKNVPFNYVDNHVSTTKYKWYSFLPKGLWEQFRRVANMYFLFHAIVSLTPVTPVNPITTILPLVFVVGVAMLKELWEDLQRGRQDRETNLRKVEVLLSDGSLQSRPWKEVQVGDIVRVEDDQYFPADLLCLSTSNPEGSCYVETMNLDGETNLKLRKALNETRLLEPAELARLSGYIECEQPNVSIYTFVGNFIPAADWPRASEKSAKEAAAECISLSPSQILLRGSRLRNTKYAYGMAVFTGFDTKIMMNATDPPSKRSVIEKRLDWIVFYQLCLLFSMSLATAIAFAVTIHNEMPEQWYLRPDDTTGTSAIASGQFNWREPGLAGLLQFFTSLVLYGYFVPISLYVSIEIVKLIQSKFINADLGMYYDERNIPPKARTSNLNEELGMIKTILSDKTGTLTRNQMEFFKCSIAGVSYGTGVTEVERAAALRTGQKLQADEEQAVYVPEKPVEKGYNMRDPRLDAMKWLTGAQAPVIRRFLEVLAVCHTVVCEGEEEPDTLKYMAESPDEAAFVVAAKRLGLFFHKRLADRVTVREYGVEGAVVGEREYTLLNTLEFTSARKRMSVVVRDPEGQLLLLCKGADNVIIARLSSDLEAQRFRRQTLDHMTEYAEAGLRTLAIAWKQLDEHVYEDWQRRWMEVKQDVASASTQAGKLEALAEELEHGLCLLGSTAIEDKLQVGVPQTIDSLARAGIKLWVLTGDKLETAINIGYACSLLRHNMQQHIIYLEDNEGVRAEAEKAGITLEKYSADTVARQIRESKAAADAARSSHGTASSHAVIIDGKSLGYVLDNRDVRLAFLELALECESVICCRVSPKQKALVTELVRHEGKQICLGVGDGANDVGMIQKANIGVGIVGEEGQQAVMASDFSIGQFRFLERLLLVHGGWSYRRISFMVNFFFYKNFVYGFTVFYFNVLFAKFTGASIYYDWYLSLYNVIFSAFPVCVVACIDQDVKAVYRIRFPRLYRAGQQNQGFTLWRIILWLGNGVYQSAAIFFVVMGAYWLATDRDSGKMVDHLLIGTTMYTAVVLVVNLIFLVCIQYWTWIHHLAVWGEIVAWFVYVLAWGALPVTWSGVAKDLFVIVASSPSFYFIVLLATVVALLPDFAFRSAKRTLAPEDHHIVQEIERLERRQHRGTPLAGEDHQRPMASTEGPPRLATTAAQDWANSERSSRRYEDPAGMQSPLSLKAASFRESWSRRASEDLTRKIDAIIRDEGFDDKEGYR